MGEKKFKIQHWHIVAVMLMVYDTVVVNFAYAVALWLPVLSNRYQISGSVDYIYTGSNGYHADSLLAHKYVQTNMAVPWHP